MNATELHKKLCKNRSNHGILKEFIYKGLITAALEQLDADICYLKEDITRLQQIKRTLQQQKRGKQ